MFATAASTESAGSGNDAIELGIENVELREADTWMLLVPADHSLAGRRGPVSLDDAARLPLIGARLHRCRMQVDAHFRARGLEPTYVFRTDENGTVHGLVAAGVGIGIVSRLAIDPRDERVRALELGPKVAPRVLALAWHRDRHRQRATDAFIDQALATAESLATPARSEARAAASNGLGGAPASKRARQDSNL